MVFLGRSEMRQIMKKGFDDIGVFVETGTYHGRTIFEMEPMFGELHTIEIAERFYKECSNRYTGHKITFHLGDSAKTIPSILDTVNKPCVFFLDGHWSGGDTGRGETDVPLLHELDAVSKYCHKCIIIIDDFRLFGYGPNSENHDIVNWENISVENILKPFQANDRKFEYCTRNDRLILYLW